MDFGVPHFHTNPYVHLYTARMIFSIRGRQNSAKQNSSTCLSKMLPLHGPSKIAATHGRIDDVQLKVPALGTTVCKLAMLLAISKPRPTSNGSKMNLWCLFYLFLIKIIFWCPVSRYFKTAVKETSESSSEVVLKQI